MQQRENLDDLVAEAKETEAQAAPAAAAAAEPGNDAQA
jgi:ribosomal protein L12E/L44/L45/RPP1/RPP2